MTDGSVQRIGQAALAAIVGAVLAPAPAMAQTSPAHGQTPRAPAATDPAVPAAGSDSPTELIPDPWSGPNHDFYRLTETVDRRVIRPVIRVYNRAVPKPIRNGLDNAIQNLDEPRTAANDILQGRFKPAGSATARFVINSTAGLAGLIDVAAKSGIERHESDFGQTLGRYGVRSGPYIFVPLAGPSSLRDGVGRLVDIFADPVGLLAGGLGTTFGDVRAGVATVDAGSSSGDQLQEVNREFTDPYATIRSVYSQQRAEQIAIARGHPQQNIESLPDFGPPPPTQAQPAAGSAAAPAAPSPSSSCPHSGCP